jgi:methylenetetrahydrofolate reductase (NADPH)
MGLHESTAILAGIIVPKNLGMLKYMNSSVAGVTVPEVLLERMEQARSSAGDDKKKARENQAEEGIKITVELIEQVREIPGVRGVHIQAIEWEHKVPEILKKAGLVPRPCQSKGGE